MANQEQFLSAMQSGYAFKGESIKQGAAMHDGKVVAEAGITEP